MRSPKPQKSKNRFGRIAELLLIGVFIAVLALTASLVWKLTGGVSAAADSPEHLIRLQIVDGSGREGVAFQIGGDLSGYTDDQLEVIVVETESYQPGRVKRSFVISRKEDRTAAAILAERIGLQSSEVIFGLLENNYQQISATLVIGEDFEKINLIKASMKEI